MKDGNKRGEEINIKFKVLEEKRIAHKQRNRVLGKFHSTFLVIHFLHRIILVLAPRDHFPYYIGLIIQNNADILNSRLKFDNIHFKRKNTRQRLFWIINEICINNFKIYIWRENLKLYRLLQNNILYSTLFFNTFLLHRLT